MAADDRLENAELDFRYMGNHPESIERDSASEEHGVGTLISHWTFAARLTDAERVSAFMLSTSR